MLKIGDFSKLTRMSSRMLRYYDEIVFLRDMGFGLSAIKEILKCCDDKKSRRKISKAAPGNKAPKGAVQGAALQYFISIRFIFPEYIQQSAFRSFPHRQCVFFHSGELLLHPCRCRQNLVPVRPGQICWHRSHNGNERQPHNGSPLFPQGLSDGF